MSSCCFGPSSSEGVQEGIALSLMGNLQTPSESLFSAISAVRTLAATSVVSRCCGLVTYPEGACASLSFCQRALRATSLGSYARDRRRAALVYFIHNLSDRFGVIAVGISVKKLSFDLPSCYEEGREIPEGLRENLTQEARVACYSMIPALRLSKSQSDWCIIQKSCLATLKKSVELSLLCSVEGWSQDFLFRVGKECRYSGQHISLWGFDDWTKKQPIRTHLDVGFLMATLSNVCVNDGYGVRSLSLKESRHLVFLVIEILLLKYPDCSLTSDNLFITDVISLIALLLLLRGYKIVAGDFHLVEEELSSEDLQLIKGIQRHLRSYSFATGHVILNSFCEASNNLFNESCTPGLVKELAKHHQKRGNMDPKDQEHMVLVRPGDTAEIFSVTQLKDILPSFSLGGHSIFPGHREVDLQIREATL